MTLTPVEERLFFNLHRSLMVFVNQRLQVLSEMPSTPEDFAHLPDQSRLEVRDAFLEDTGLIEQFVQENPAHLSSEELEIVSSWQHFVKGHFFIFREMANYTVFLTTKEHPIAYGVTALSQPFEELIGPNLPVMIEAVLLPFRDKIVYDGVLIGLGISLSFGPGVRRMLKEDFKKAKQRYGIVTSLPVATMPGGKLSAADRKPTKAKKSRSKKTKPDDPQEVLAQIVGMIDAFCRDHLNEEYAVLCRKLAEKLARKRPSPLLNGQPNVWVVGILRTIGMVNFLSDRSQKPHMKPSDIDNAFGVGESTGSGKSAAIRKLLKIHRFDHQWILPSRVDENPLVWMLTINGFPMDIRYAPRGAQEAAFEKGLIPYIPADRE